MNVIPNFESLQEIKSNNFDINKITYEKIKIRKVEIRKMSKRNNIFIVFETESKRADKNNQDYLRNRADSLYSHQNRCIRYSIAGAYAGGGGGLESPPTKFF